MSYKIRVNCVCGKILQIPEKYAGKRGKCPSCGKRIAIPSIGAIGKKTPKQKETRSCPTCGAFLNAEDKVCISCRTDLGTGEWDIEGKNIRPRAQKMPVATIFIFLIALALGAATFFLISSRVKSSNQTDNDNDKGLKAYVANTKKKPVKKIKPQPIPKPTKPVKPVKIVKNESKIEEEKLRREKEAKEEMRLILDEKEHMQRWLKLKELQIRYGTTKYVRANINRYIREAEAEMVKLVKGEIQKARELLEKKKNKILLARSVNIYYLPLKYSYAEADDFQEKLDEYTNLCRKALKKPIIIPEVSIEAKLKNLKDRYYQVELPKCWRLVEKGNFNEACRKLAPIVEKAKEMQKQFPQDTDLHKIINFSEEAGRLKELRTIFTKAANNLVGKKFTFYLREATTTGKKNPRVIIEGVVKNMKRGMISVQEKGRSKLTRFKVGLIKPKHLGRLMEEYNEADGFLYLYLSAYYYMNDLPNECLETCKKALEKRISPDKVEKYQAWAKKRIEEMKTEKPVEVEPVEVNQIPVKKARAVVRRIINFYKAGNDIQTLNTLGKLKKLLKNRRDTLIKINKRCKKRHGLNLTAICEECYNHCDRCKNTGWLKCPKCLGSGSIQPDSKVIKYSTITPKSKPCTHCGQRGEIRCSSCRKKRDNRTYMLLLSFYKDL